MGHAVVLIPPQYVKPFVKRNKDDAADAEAICEAMMRPTMPTVPVKSVEQQAILSLHRARQGFVKARTAQANQIRGLLWLHLVQHGVKAIQRKLDTAATG